MSEYVWAVFRGIGTAFGLALFTGAFVLALEVGVLLGKHFGFLGVLLYVFFWIATMLAVFNVLEVSIRKEREREKMRVR